MRAEHAKQYPEEQVDVDEFKKRCSLSSSRGLLLHTNPNVIGKEVTTMAKKKPAKKKPVAKKKVAKKKKK